jgi:RNA 3'-terminal phosphate cyclase (ATP)
MIVVDGSQGEGGGQILRTAVALSAVAHEPVRITHIRARRPNPGLAPSHVTSVEAVSALCDAKVDDLYPGSRDITFHPGELLGGDFRFDIGTAGSISLVIQGLLLPALLSKSRTTITLTGGTNVKWSPPIDYMTRVHIPLIEKFGAKCDIEVTSRGFYPEGGGEVRLDVDPVGRPSPISLTSPGKVSRVRGVAFSQNLPDHVITRMKHAAMKRLVKFADVKVASESSSGVSVGAGMLLAAECENSILGASALGEKGVRAERLGESCADDLIETIGSGAAVDDYMVDQVLPYMAVASGSSVVVAEEVTEHARTNMLVIEQMLHRTFSVEKMEGLVKIYLD